MRDYPAHYDLPDAPEPVDPVREAAVSAVDARFGIGAYQLQRIMSRLRKAHDVQMAEMREQLGNILRAYDIEEKKLIEREGSDEGHAFRDRRPDR